MKNIFWLIILHFLTATNMTTYAQITQITDLHPLESSIKNLDTDIL